MSWECPEAHWQGLAAQDRLEGLADDLFGGVAGLGLLEHALHFDYEQAFGQLPEAYETLLRDIMIGDQTLFVSADFTETAWRLYAPLLTGEKSVHLYTAGSWGPSEADALLEKNGHQWALGW